MEQDSTEGTRIFVREKLPVIERIAADSVRGVFLPSSLLRMFDGKYGAAILFAQFLYWSSKSPDREEGWFYNTQEQYRQQIGMAPDGQLLARRTCLQMGLIEEVKKGSPPRIYTRVDYGRYIELLKEHNEEANCDFPQYPGMAEINIGHPRKSISGIPGYSPSISKETTEDTSSPAAEKPKKAARVKAPRAEKAPDPEVEARKALRKRTEEIVIFWHYDGNGPMDGEWDQIGKASKKIEVGFGGDLARIEAAHAALQKDAFFKDFHKIAFFKIAGILHQHAPKVFVASNPQNLPEGSSRASQRQEQGIWKSWRETQANCGRNTTLASLEQMTMTRADVALWRSVPAIWAEVEAFFAARVS